MTTMVIILNVVMSLFAAGVLAWVALVAGALRPGSPSGTGRADWRGGSALPLVRFASQRTAASIATETNSSAR